MTASFLPWRILAETLYPSAAVALVVVLLGVIACLVYLVFYLRQQLRASNERFQLLDHDAPAALREKTHEQERQLDIAHRLAESIELNPVMEAIAHESRQLLKANGCNIYLVDPTGKVLLPMIAEEPDFVDEILAEPLDIDKSYTGQAVKARHSMIFNNAGADPGGHQIPGTPLITDERLIITPFIIDGQVIGAMCLNRRGRNYSMPTTWRWLRPSPPSLPPL